MQIKPGVNMAWNDPDNDDRKDDPWGSRSGKNDQGPPDLDQVLSDLMKKFSSLFGGGKSGRNGGGDGGGNISWGLVGLVLVAVGVIYAGAGFYTLDEQERGVVLRLGRAQEAVVQPGLHWNPPLIDEVIPVNVTRIYDQTFSNTMLTEDENIVDITMSVQYQIADARKYVLEVEDPEISLSQAAESSVRHVVGGSVMDDVINVGRAVLAQDTLVRLQNYLDAYGTGIIVIQVNIAQSQPPQQVRAAFDDVVKAREDNQSYQNEARRYANQVIPEARGFARREIEEAQAYREQVIARAEGEARRFDQLLVEYQKAPAVTRERLYLDTMQSVLSASSKVMIDVEGSNNMMYLPLDQLLQRRNSGNVSVDEMPNANTGSANINSNSIRQAPARGTSR